MAHYWCTMHVPRGYANWYLYNSWGSKEEAISEAKRIYAYYDRVGIRNGLYGSIELVN